MVGNRSGGRADPHAAPQVADRSVPDRKDLHAMSLETPVTTREKTRVFVTGSCDGLAELREALGRHSEVEMVGWSEGVLESAATLTGGHLQVVLHGTRSSGLPEDELAGIREHTQAPVILLASGEAS